MHFKLPTSLCRILAFPVAQQQNVPDSYWQAQLFKNHGLEIEIYFMAHEYVFINALAVTIVVP
jgi:hypothetical protein